jgi:hypothetical protein
LTNVNSNFNIIPRSTIGDISRTKTDFYDISYINQSKNKLSNSNSKEEEEDIKLK